MTVLNDSGFPHYAVMALVLILATATAALVLTLTWRVLNWVWLRPKYLEKCLRKQGFSGNPYRLLHGDTKENSKFTKEALSSPIGLSDSILMRVQPFIHHTLQKHGKNSFIWLGQVPCVNIMDPLLVKEIMLKYEEFQKPNTNPVAKMLVKGLVAYEGEKWSKHRKIINPAFHLEKLKCILSEFYVSCSEMMSKWEDKVSEKGACEIDVWPYLDSLSGDVISRAAFGSSYEEGKKIFLLQKEQIQLAMKVLHTVYIPGFRYLPTETNRRMKKINKEMQILMNKIISKRENLMKEGKASNDDLLSILLESNSKEAEENENRSNNIGLTIEEVVEECKVFYLAGRDTTSVLLVWSMILLGMHPQWQQRAREEVLSIFGNGKPDFNGLNNLKVMTMILYEVLRLYPPVILMYRMTYNHTKLGDMVLPPGVQISIPTMFIHMDPEHWGPDAHVFNPERFAEGIAKATGGKVSLVPFGWGPRICVGQNFAMLEVKMALAMIMQRYWFEVSPSYAHAPYLVTSLQPQLGAPLILHKLSV